MIINGVSATGQTRRNRRNTSQFIGSGQAEDRAMHASDVLAGAADRSQPAPQGGAVVLKATIRHDTEENAKVSVCRSAHDFRSSLGSGHRHGRSACLKSAQQRKSRSRSISNHLCPRDGHSPNEGRDGASLWKSCFAEAVDIHLKPQQIAARYPLRNAKFGVEFE